MPGEEWVPPRMDPSPAGEPSAALVLSTGFFSTPPTSHLKPFNPAISINPPTPLQSPFTPPQKLTWPSSQGCSQCRATATHPSTHLKVHRPHSNSTQKKKKKKQSLGHVLCCLGGVLPSLYQLSCFCISPRIY